MLADLLPLMTEEVTHWHKPVRNLFGKPATDKSEAGADFTTHRARVTFTPGEKIGPASRDGLPDAAATVWLLDHPRPIAIGDTFTLPSGETLAAKRLERRTHGTAILYKVYLT